MASPLQSNTLCAFCHQGKWRRLDGAATFCYHPIVNSKHRQTLQAVFSDPVSGNIEWRRIESLLIALGCEVVGGRGSRVTFVKGEAKAAFHRPHPGKEALKYRVVAVRDFLELLGVKP